MSTSAAHVLPPPYPNPPLYCESEEKQQEDQPGSAVQQPRFSNEVEQKITDIDNQIKRLESDLKEARNRYFHKDPNLTSSKRKERNHNHYLTNIKPINDKIDSLTFEKRKLVEGEERKVILRKAFIYDGVPVILGQNGQFVRALPKLAEPRISLLDRVRATLPEKKEKSTCTKVCDCFCCILGACADASSDDEVEIPRF